MLSSNDGVFNKLTTVPPSREGEKETTRAEPNTVLPKLIEISINFQPIHERTLGTGAGNETFTVFPYGVTLADSKPVRLPPAAAKLIQLQRDAEAKRQTAAAEQQKLDNLKAQIERVNNKIKRAERRVQDTSELEQEKQRLLNQEGFTETSAAITDMYADQAESALDEYGEFL
jgi:hypothetical protein